jgi:hypothetical protein
MECAERLGRLKVVMSTCGNGECPTIFEIDDEMVVVQGDLFPVRAGDLPLPLGEGRVAVPRHLLVDAYPRLTGAV